MSETKICRVCKNNFAINDIDYAFYKKTDVPSPTLCSDCRLQRRLAWRNEKTLYKRVCDLCKQGMIAIFPADSPFTVYCQDCWWSDKWDPLSFGRKFDFSKPFFPQFADLLKVVPMYGLVNDVRSLENSAYVNYVTDAKNCYLVFAANFLEDCMYSSYIWESKDTLDCHFSTKLERCYACLDCDNLFNCIHLQNSRNCSDCMYGYELKNCRNCFGCVNLNSKEYCYFNKQLTKEEYLKRIQTPEDVKNKFYEFSLTFPKRATFQINCENSTGDCIKNCKNALECFDGYGGQDIKWINNFPGSVKDCYDISGCAKLELCIDSHALFPGYKIKYSNACLNGGYELSYCAFTDGGRNLFGCIGTKKTQNAILNKNYSASEYKVLIERIIQHMKKTGEYGEFFPISISPFAYEETVAQEYFPLNKEKKHIEISKPQEIQNKENIIQCVQCSKHFKILPQEIKFYKTMKLNVPSECFDCRRKNILQFRNPRKIWQRTCAKCKTIIQTNYAPDRPESVYCEACYLATVY